MGADLLAVDWAATPLGPIERWPRSLETVVRVLLTSRFAMWMAWGPQLTFLCNDAYRRDTLGRKYPWALGRPAHEVWAEIWPEIGPRIETVMQHGGGDLGRGADADPGAQRLPRGDLPHVLLQPAARRRGLVAGMLCVVSEETKRVIGERRMATLRELGSVSWGLTEEREFLDAASDVLAGNLRSLPFTIVYLFEDGASARWSPPAASSRGIRRRRP